MATDSHFLLDSVRSFAAAHAHTCRHTVAAKISPREIASFLPLNLIRSNACGLRFSENMGTSIPEEEYGNILFGFPSFFFFFFFFLRNTGKWNMLYCCWFEEISPALNYSQWVVTFFQQLKHLNSQLINCHHVRFILNIFVKFRESFTNFWTSPIL